MDAPDTANSPAAEVEALTKRIDKLYQQPPLPHAAWKKLVQDVQVMHADMHMHRLIGGGWAKTVMPQKHTSQPQPTCTCTCTHRWQRGRLTFRP